MCVQPKSVNLENHLKMSSRPLRLMEEWAHFPKLYKIFLTCWQHVKNPMHIMVKSQHSQFFFSINTMMFANKTGLAVDLGDSNRIVRHECFLDPC